MTGLYNRIPTSSIVRKYVLIYLLLPSLSTMETALLWKRDSIVMEISFSIFDRMYHWRVEKTNLIRGRTTLYKVRRRFFYSFLRGTCVSMSLNLTKCLHPGIGVWSYFPSDRWGMLRCLKASSWYSIASSIVSFQNGSPNLKVVSTFQCPFLVRFFSPCVSVPSDRRDNCFLFWNVQR